MKRSLLVAAIFAVLPAQALPAGSRWTPPVIPAAPASLPKLSQPLVLDGALGEWNQAACVPMLSESYILYSREPHKWNGPADAGMEVYCAWSERGLCLAAVVADDDVRNDRQGKDYWEQDCVEFFVDGRAGDKLMTEPYSKGAYQILVRPPLGRQPPHAVLNPRDGRIEGLEVAGKRTQCGYTLELLVPWSAFPGFLPKTGGAMGQSFALNDYDKRDGKLIQPLVLSYRAADNLWQFPQNFIRWEFIDATESTGGGIEPQVAMDVPAVLTTGEPLQVNVGLGGALARRAASVTVTVVDGSGGKAFEKATSISPLPVPWESSSAARVVVPVTGSGDAYYTITAVVKDKQGRALGTVSRPCLCVGNALRDAITLLRKTDLRAMSRTQPFRAAQYLGIGARIEQLKRWIEKRNIPETIRNARDLEARLDLQMDGKLDLADAGFFGLVTLGAVPEAQVAVEFTSTVDADVTFYCGSIPITSAAVRAADPAAGKPQAVRVSSPVPSIVEKVTAIVQSGQPVKPEEVNSLRTELVKALAPKTPAPKLPEGASLYCGDLHVHSFFSDGSSSPQGMALQSMYCFMDYMALTDHNRIDGAQLVQKQLAEHGFDYPLTVGEEITTEWSHFNAYPLKEVVSEKLPLDEMVKAAHSQGAVIQWNHPHAVDSEWMRSQIPKCLEGTGLDAWEHIPNAYDEWKTAGKLPVITGTTDTHNGTFGDQERTVIIAPAAEGDDIAEAIRRGRAAAIWWKGPHYLYGPDEATALVWAALADGKGLRAAKAERIRKVLAKADLPALIEASRPRSW